MWQFDYQISGRKKAIYHGQYYNFFFKVHSQNLSKKSMIYSKD